MIIVSQDKNEIINFNKITEIVANENEIVITDNIYKNYGETIGIYKTKERAKEVLQEIINTYKFNTCEAVGQKQTVYEMPENKED